jgi:putative SOS response-associated peptidase YedK
VFRPEGPLCFAGLMSLWKLEGQLPVINCAVLTREAPVPLSTIHPRIPLVLPPAAFENWLNPNLRSAPSSSSRSRSRARAETDGL